MYSRIALIGLLASALTTCPCAAQPQDSSSASDLAKSILGQNGITPGEIPHYGNYGKIFVAQLEEGGSDSQTVTCMGMPSLNENGESVHQPQSALPALT